MSINQKHLKANSAGTRPPTNGDIWTSTYRPSIYATMVGLITEAWNDIIQFSYYKKSTYPKNDVTTL
jgi:hypothetical protein